MPVSFDSNTEAALAAGRLIRRSLLVLDLASGLHGFHSGMGPFTWNSIDFIGAGSFISVSALQQGTDLSSKKLVINVDPNLEEEIGTNVLTDIEDETYHRRSAYLYTAFHDPDTGDLLSVELFYEGRIDQIIHSEQLGKDSVLSIQLASRFYDHKHSGHRVRTDVDQKLIDSDDNGLRHVSIVGNETTDFGQTPEKPGKKPPFGGGGGSPPPVNPSQPGADG